MKRLLVLLFIMYSMHGLLQGQRIEKDLSTKWRFIESDLRAAINPSYEDSGWSIVDVPHDWSFEKGISRSGSQKDAGGYHSGGIGWYRKEIKVPKAWYSKNVRLEFDGVYMNSEVWINGHYLGKRPYGYISFSYNLSKYLKEGSNIISVRVDNSKEPSARWYHPCGIYAPVRLVITDINSIAYNGIYLTTHDITDSQATVEVATTFNLKGKETGSLELETSVLNKAGEQLSIKRTKLSTKKNGSILKQHLLVKKPNVWSPKNPYLYKVYSRLLENGKVIDELFTTLGIRSTKWKASTGFWLNNKNTKLLGVSEHWEGGPIGGAWSREMLKWKLQLLKDMGCNSIRTSHNPVPSFFYDLCDTIGIMVMDEIFDGWGRKAPHDYGAQAFNQWWHTDLTSWLKRDRNHPSVILYSVGNETRGKVAKDLVATCHKLDPTRPVTSGHSGSEFMDVVGVNGACERKQFFDNARPNKPFLATEAPHTWQTRGYYRTKTWYRDGNSKGKGIFEIPDLTKKEVFTYEWKSPKDWKNRKQHFNSSYDNATVRISARKNWELMRDLPWFSGHFRWTGFDYYGEAGYVHGGWPFRLFMGGALDVAGFKKDLYYFYQSQWTTKPMVHILPNWTNPTLKPNTIIPVWVYSNTDEVELFLNGKSLGKLSPGKEWNKMQCEWDVPWKPGTLRAVAYNKGKKVVESELVTAQAPSKMHHAIEKGDLKPTGKDIAIITTTLTDKKGHLYPYGENPVYYHIDGPVRIRSLESGSPVDTTNSLKTNMRRAFMGCTRAFLQTTTKRGNIGVVIGSIVGERQLLTSKKVSIAVDQITLRGDAQTDNIRVYYTTDGSTPSTQSKLYKKPFGISLGTTVKAIVVRKGDILFSMKESFSKDLGLYWGNDKEFKNAVNVSDGTQSEDSEFKGATIKTKGKGFSGKGYLDFNNKEGYVKWYQENDGSAGMYTLKFRYAMNDPKRERPMDVFVNGRKLTTIKFKKTGSWNSRWSTIEVKCKLYGGANYIKLCTTGESAPNIDELIVK